MILFMYIYFSICNPNIQLKIYFTESQYELMYIYIYIYTKFMLNYHTYVYIYLLERALNNFYLIYDTCQGNKKLLHYYDLSNK